MFLLVFFSVHGFCEASEVFSSLPLFLGANDSDFFARCGDTTAA